jgi:hypothetical protein
MTRSTDHSHTQLVTISNYSAISTLRTLQFTVTHSLTHTHTHTHTHQCSPSVTIYTSRFLETESLTVEILWLPLSQLNQALNLFHSQLLRTDHVENTVFNSSSVVVC